MKTSYIRVCHGPECRECGGPELLKSLHQKGLQAEREHCQGLCAYAPVVHIGDGCIGDATIKKIMIQQSNESEKQDVTVS